MRRRTILFGLMVKDIINEEQGTRGTFHLGVLPTIAPYLLPRFSADDGEISRAGYPCDRNEDTGYPPGLHTGDIVLSLASVLEDAALSERSFYEQFMDMFPEKEPLFGRR